MVLALRMFFAVVLVSMLVVTSWASAQVPLWAIPRSVGAHPWFIATLFDAYWGFFTFYAWQWYKEPSWPARAWWFVALVLLGNMAMAVYGLAVVWRLPRDAEPARILLRGTPLPAWLPAVLVLAFAGVALAARSLSP